MFLSWYLFVPAYYFLAVVYLVFGVHNTRFIKCILKCLPVLTLLFQVLAVFMEYTGSGGNQPDKILSTKQFLWGVTFSGIGDGCLVFQKVGTVGVISFAVSLCFYISMLGFVESLLNIGFGGIICGFGVLLLSLTILLVFRSHTKKARIKPLPAKSVFTVLIFLYFSVLSTLLWSAAVLVLRQNNFAGLLSGVGATLFYISDMFIVASAIWDARLLQGRVLIMMTYYTAQLLFAISLYSTLHETQ